MSLTSQSFFIFLAVMVAAYYLLPWFQKYILLIGGLGFYYLLSSFSGVKLICVVVYVWAVTYLGAILIDRSQGKAKSALTVITLLAMIAPLFVFKYAYNIANGFASLLNAQADFSYLQFAAIAGMSYYMLSAMGYVIEVAWQNFAVERDPFTVGLFVFYFPQMVCGPISRFSEMREQFVKRHGFDVTNFSRGIRRMVFGYFKLLIVAELFGRAVRGVYADIDAYSGIGILLATLCYIIELYADFSGCIDICLGASLLFDIRLPENFLAPFFTREYRELWHRWHVTLGNWFRDFVMYPLLISDPLVRLAKKVKKKYGKKTAKNIPVYVASAVTWFMLGVWHGCIGYYFFASAIVPGILLVVVSVLGPYLEKWTKAAGIRTETAGFRLFERFRTMLLFSLSVAFVCNGSIGGTLHMWARMISHPIGYGTIDQAMYDFGLSSTDGILMCVGFAAILFEQYCIERETTVYDWSEKQPVYLVLILLFIELFIILTHALVGRSAFIYFQF